MSGNQRNPLLVLHPVFLLALLVLIGNDRFWKYTFSNVLTGKLSDIAGLVLLPLVLCFLFPKLRSNSVWLSGLFFLVWKTPLVTPVIDLYNLVAPIPISRVVDYTDYWALLVLPLPYLLIRRQGNNNRKLPLLNWRAIASSLVLLVTSLSFIATQPPPWYSFQQSSGNVTFYNNRYKTGMTRSKVLAALATHGIYATQDTAFASQVRLRNWIINDSILAHDPPFYRIPSLVVDDDTLHEVQFSLMSNLKGKDKVILLINGLQVDELNEVSLDRKLRRMYRKMLKKEIVRRSL